jgi:hypothetical protein
MKNQKTRNKRVGRKMALSVKLFFSLLFCFLMGNHFSIGQSFTQFKYEVSGEQNAGYEGLLSILTDGTTTARIKKVGQPGENPTIFELSLTDSLPAGTADTRFLVDTGMADVTHLTDAQLPHRPVFEFKAIKEPGGLFYTFSTLLISQNGQWEKVTNLTKTDYEYTDISIDLVNSFYSKDDPFYEEYFSKPRVSDLAARGGLSTTDRKRKIHLIIVADLNDPSMGASCRIDMNNMTNTFTNLAKDMKMIPNTPSITNLTGSNFNKSAVLRAVNGLKPGKNDIVIFYFTGHGFRDSGDTRSDLPRMVLSNNPNPTMKQLLETSLAMQDIVDILQKKTSSFNLVMNDCCNVEFPVSRSIAQSGLTTPKSISSRVYPKNFERLFIKPKGTMVFSSSSPKQYSVGNALVGGFFTWHFRVALGKYLSAANSNFTWNNVFLEAAQNANRQAKSGLCPKDSDIRCVQVPKMFPYLK